MHHRMGLEGKCNIIFSKKACKRDDGWCDGIQFKYAYFMETSILRFGMIFTEQLNQIKIIVEKFAWIYSWHWREILALVFGNLRLYFNLVFGCWLSLIHETHASSIHIKKAPPHRTPEFRIVNWKMPNRYADRSNLKSWQIVFQNFNRYT